MENIYKYPSITSSVLKNLRLKSELSQSYVGNLFGKSKSTISRIENAIRKLSDLELVEYLKVLGTSYQEFSNIFISLVKFREIGEKASYAHELNENDNIEKNAIENDRSKIISTLTDYFQNKPVNKVYLFGSIARNEFSSTSDIDLYVDFREDFKVSLFDLSNYKIELSQLTGREVDIVMKGTEYSFITEGLNKDKVEIYG